MTLIPLHPTRLHFGAATLSEPRFGHRKYATPDLKAAWNNPEARSLLEKTMLKGMFRQAPALGHRFLQELDRQCRLRKANDKRYEALAQFLQRPEYRELFQTTFGNDESARFDRRFQQMLDLVPPALKPTRFVDIGCGTGQLTSRLVAHWKLAKDDAFGLEAFARPKGTENFHYQLFDGKSMPLSAGGMDLGTMLMVLHHADDPDRLIGEAYRILKPGGRLIVRECDAPTPGSQLFNDVMDHLYYKVFNNLPGIPTPANHFGAEEWKRRFQAQGFIVERTLHPEPDNPFMPVHFVLRKT